MHRRSQDAATSYPSPRTRACLSLVFARSVMLLLSAAVLALVGCATAESQRAEQAAATGGDAITIENLLRWPLAGADGVEKAVSTIRQTLETTRQAIKGQHSDEEFHLEDGYILRYRDVWEGSGAVIGLASEPCFSPIRAAEIIGAQPGPVIYDPDGADRGRIYRVIRNGIRMHVRTTPLTYQCVASIGIYTLPNLENSPITRHDVTLESLLRWSLEGQEGIDKIKAGLHQVFDDMEPLPNQQFSSRGVAYLADGVLLSFSSIAELSGHIGIGVKEDRCLLAEPYAELIGAKGSVTLDAHGIDRGKTYSVRQNGMLVRIDTTPITYHCIRHIRISPIHKKSMR